ncbi:MAG: flagellar biosynthesis anti-sigma factor FlgM [Acidobacteriota bacterium]|nr:flagellar biosynthesis anti-sigma factor FlgM [Acidobacteriota bacterium]
MATDSAPGSNTRPAVEESKNSGKSDSRQYRLAEIQAKVQNGTYKIDALELSKRIIQKHIVR